MTTLPNPVLFERLTTDNAALLLIDMQTGLMLGVTTSSTIALKNNILGLAQVGKVFNLPTLLTTSAATGPNGPYLPEVVAMFPGQQVQNRTAVNAWDDEAFVAAVEKTGRKKLIIAGITTDVCLLFPALSAVAAGYDVYAVVDASGSFNPQTELAAMMRMTQAGVKVTGWTSVAAELQRDWALPVAQEAGKVLAQYLTPIGYLADNLAAQQAAGQPQSAHA